MRILVAIILGQDMEGLLERTGKFALALITDGCCNLAEGESGGLKKRGGLFHAMFLGMRRNGIAELVPEYGFDCGCVNAEVLRQGFDGDMLIKIGI